MTRSRIVLAERLSIVQVAALHLSLREALTQPAGITLDGSAVREIDTAVLQLLASFWCSCRAQGIDCAWQEISPSLRRSATLIGLTEALYLPASAPGGLGDARL